MSKGIPYTERQLMDVLEASDLNRRIDPTTPEQELLKRILEIALHDYVLLNIRQHEPLTVSGIPTRLMHRDVARWIFGSDEVYEWGFCWVCEHLGLDISYVRTKTKIARLEVLRRYANGTLQYSQNGRKSVRHCGDTKKAGLPSENPGETVRSADSESGEDVLCGSERPEKGGLEKRVYSSATNLLNGLARSPSKDFTH